MIKLYHEKELIGTITNEEWDGLWQIGSLQMTPEGERFLEFFAFITDEDNMTKDPPFSKTYLEGWSVEDEHGVRQRIGIPAVHENGTQVGWRHR